MKWFRLKPIEAPAVAEESQITYKDSRSRLESVLIMCFLRVFSRLLLREACSKKTDKYITLEIYLLS